MNQKDVIKELCALASRVGEEVFKHSCAHDCFCGEIENNHFQFDEKILDFIKNAVNEDINNHTKQRIIP